MWLVVLWGRFNVIGRTENGEGLAVSGALMWKGRAGEVVEGVVFGCDWSRREGNGSVVVGALMWLVAQ